jgi:hypothetical protein
MYDRIVNPLTGRYVSVKGTIGKAVLKNYLKQLGGVDSEANETLVFCHGKLNIDIYNSDADPQDQELMDEILKTINVHDRTNVTTIDLNPNNEPDIESNYTNYIDNLFGKHESEKNKNYIFMSCPVTDRQGRPIPLSYFIHNNAKKLVITNFFDILISYGISIEPIIKYINLKSDKSKLNIIVSPHSTEIIDGMTWEKYSTNLTKKLAKKMLGTDSYLRSTLVDIIQNIKYFTKINQISYTQYLPESIRTSEKQIFTYIAPSKYGIITERDNRYLK